MSPRGAAVWEAGLENAMIRWEKVIQRYYAQLSFRTEWIRPRKGVLFLLAWEGKRAHIILVDLKGILGEISSEAARNLFLDLLSFLRKRSSWDRIFKGREVSCKWLMLKEPSEKEGRTLRLAGVEPFSFLRFWEKGEE